MKAVKLIEGLKVLDLTNKTGYVTLELADNGAEVLKVEKVSGGDSVRTTGMMKNGESLFHRYINRGKKSIAIDLEKEEGKALFKELVKNVDVLVENFVPDTMENMGLGYDVLKEINPRLIYAQLTPFGNTGEYKHIDAPEILVQAQASIMDVTGPKEEPPTWVKFDIGEHYANIYLACAIMIAIYHREDTGLGQKVDVAKTDALFSITEDKIACYYIGRINPTRLGNAHPLICPYDVMKTKDGYCALGVSTEAQWNKFCAVLKMDEIAANPEYATNIVRSKHYFIELRNMIEAVTMQYGKQELAELLATVGIPSAAINSTEEAMTQEQIKARKMLVDVDGGKAGIIATPNRTLRVGEGEDFEYKGAPELGEDTQDILESLNFTKEEIKAMYDNGIVA